VRRQSVNFGNINRRVRFEQDFENYFHRRVMFKHDVISQVLFADVVFATFAQNRSQRRRAETARR
jgi:hypothetical protein